ncbi:MAG: transposase [bacterium]|nr:transposase [bacterium]
MTLFRNKYRVESARLTGWDYSQPGYYFVTICTHDRGCLFGKIIDGEMRLNEYGQGVKEEWHKTGQQRLNLHLDEFIVMPNHIHGIIQIATIISDGGRSRGVARNASTTTAATTAAGPATDNDLRTGPLAETTETGEIQQVNQITKNETMSAISPESGSLPVIVRSFKSAITKRVNELRKTPGSPVWQSRFHDHIIRDEQELFRIRHYIKNNPVNWDRDKFNADGCPGVSEDGAEYENEIIPGM